MTMERRQIGELRREAEGRAGVLVTLVRTEGSSYRRCGARLLVTGGRSAGTLSGGCLEGEVIRKAPWLVKDGARVERYSTLFDDTAEIPFGLGCGGTVDLLFEPMDAPEGRALLEAMEASLTGREATVVSFLPGGGRGLRRLILGADGAVMFRSEGLSDQKVACAQELTPGEVYEGRYVERLAAPQRLFVFGAGEDARPVVEMAAAVGFAVTVADGRRQLAQSQRFPRAERVVWLGEDLQAMSEQLGIRANDAVVLMTHSYEQDRALLTGLLPLAPRYLGLLGSRHRSSILLAETAAMLGRTIEHCCEGVYAPVGMDLGGDGPEAIALAIVAEVQAAANGKLGGSRRLSADEVAAQIELGGASRYLQTQCGLDDLPEPPALEPVQEAG